MNELTLLENKTERDKLVERYEVLDKVKDLILLAGTEFATVKQVADFYEVGEEAIVAIYSRHTDELEADGMYVAKYKELSNLQYENLKTSRGKVTFTFKNGTELDFPTRGLKVFPRRAILRIGMLLRDSEIAKEVRTQLLNIEEKTSTETKITDINEEQSLMFSLGMAMASGDINALAVASANMMAFKNRHIEKIETENIKLRRDNEALANGILEWSDRAKLNAGVRKYAKTTGEAYSDVWKELYRYLAKHFNIHVYARGSSPYIQHIREHEWNKVIKVFSAMCQAHKISVTDMFE